MRAPGRVGETGSGAVVRPRCARLARVSALQRFRPPAHMMRAQTGGVRVVGSTSVESQQGGRSELREWRDEGRDKRGGRGEDNSNEVDGRECSAGRRRVRGSAGREEVGGEVDDGRSAGEAGRRRGAEVAGRGGRQGVASSHGSGAGRRQSAAKGSGGDWVNGHASHQLGRSRLEAVATRATIRTPGSSFPRLIRLQ